MELIVFVGLQGAGKSSFYRSRFAATHVHVSKDRLRSSRNPRRRQRHLIEEALSQGRSVAVDNTNPTPQDRAELVGLARAFGAETACYLFRPDVKASLARNAERAGHARVPPAAIYATAKRLVLPRREEGFDRLYQVEVAEDGEFRVAELA